MFYLNQEIGLLAQKIKAVGQLGQVNFDNNMAHGHSSSDLSRHSKGEISPKFNLRLAEVFGRRRGSQQPLDGYGKD